MICSFCSRGHARFAEDDRFAAAVRQAGRGVLPSHGTGEPKAFLNRHIGRHSYAADSGPARSVVDHDDRSQLQARTIDVNDPRWPEGIGKTEWVFHVLLLRNIGTDHANLTRGRSVQVWFASTHPHSGTAMSQNGRRPEMTSANAVEATRSENMTGLGFDVSRRSVLVLSRFSASRLSLPSGIAQPHRRWRRDDRK